MRSCTCIIYGTSRRNAHAHYGELAACTEQAPLESAHRQLSSDVLTSTLTILAGIIIY